jgi:hypothetical protein
MDKKESLNFSQSQHCLTAPKIRKEKIEKTTLSTQRQINSCCIYVTTAFTYECRHFSV